MSLKKDRWHYAKDLRRCYKQIPFVTSQKMAKAILDWNYKRAVAILATELKAERVEEDEHYSFWTYRYYDKDNNFLFEYSEEPVSFLDSLTF